MCKFLPIIAVAAIIMSPARAAATFYGDGPLMQPSQEMVQDLRAARLLNDRPADQRQRDVRIAAAVGAAGLAAFLAVVGWRRRVGRKEHRQ